MRFILIYTTVGRKKDAERLSSLLVKKRLCACANYFKIGSFYHWERKLVKDQEYGILLKAPFRNYKRIERELLSIHPYELPCIIGFEIEKGFKGYLDWIMKETKG